MTEGFHSLQEFMSQTKGLLYLLVLFSLLPIPHMERYNHVAVLPAMAWLWRWGWFMARRENMNRPLYL